MYVYACGICVYMYVYHMYACGMSMYVNVTRVCMYMCVCIWATLFVHEVGKRWGGGSRGAGEKYWLCIMSMHFIKVWNFQRMKHIKRAGDLARQLRSLVAFVEDPGLVPSIHMAAQNYLTLVSRNPMSSSDVHRHQACRWYTNIHVGKTLTHKIK